MNMERKLKMEEEEERERKKEGREKGEREKSVVHLIPQVFKSNTLENHRDPS